MNIFSFSILDALSFAFRTLIKKLHWFIFPIIIYIFFENLDKWAPLMLKTLSLQQEYVTLLKSDVFIYSLSILANIIASVIATQIALNLTIEDSRKEFKDQLPRFMIFVKMFFATAIYYLMLIIGYLLLIYPGIILQLRLQFYDFYIVEYDCGIIESFKMSWNITYNEKLKLFFVIIIFILISSLFYIFEPLIGKINIYLMLSLIFLVAAIFMVFKTLVKANIYKQLKPQVDPIE